MYRRSHLLRIWLKGRFPLVSLEGLSFVPSRRLRYRRPLRSLP